MVIDHVALRKARELLWYGTATVTAWEDVEDPITFETTLKQVILLTDVPCKLSHKTIYSNNQTDGPALLKQAIKVSLGNEHVIPPGCLITITQSGKTATYKRSGEVAQFIVHQEIPLVIAERDA